MTGVDGHGRSMLHSTRDLGGQACHLGTRLGCNSTALRSLFLRRRSRSVRAGQRVDKFRSAGLHAGRVELVEKATYSTMGSMLTGGDDPKPLQVAPQAVFYQCSDREVKFLRAPAWRLRTFSLRSAAASARRRQRHAWAATRPTASGIGQTMDQSDRHVQNWMTVHHRCVSIRSSSTDSINRSGGSFMENSQCRPDATILHSGT